MALNLPTPQVLVAFNPTYGGNTVMTASQVALSDTSYWTDVTSYVIDFPTKGGKQHFLDRVEPATIELTLNNRDGFFNGSPYLMDVRLPVAVTGTWSGTTYPVYFGLTDNIKEHIIDELNSELDVQCSDLTKMLSLEYLNKDSFWTQYVTGTSAPSTAQWYRFGVPAQATVTGATSSDASGNPVSSASYYVTYAGDNAFAVGQYVTVTGLPSLNTTTNVITAVTQSSFTVSTGVSALSACAGSGSAYIANIYEAISNSSNGQVFGTAAAPLNGAIIYTGNGCIDLGNGSTTNGAAYTNINASAILPGGLDFWILGAGLAGQSIITVDAYIGSTPYTITLNCRPATAGQSESSSGVLGAQIWTTGSSPTLVGNVVGPLVPINDGYWHHVGIVTKPSGLLELYCDGQLATGAANLESYGNFVFGSGSLNTLNFGQTTQAVTRNFTCSCQIDEVVVTNLNNQSTLIDELYLRYRAGSLLQLGYPVDSLNWYSGDRIAEVLCLAGFGSIELVGSAGQVVLPSGLFNIATSYKSFSSYSYGNVNGSTYTEPYYWDSPIFQSTALDLISQITDTDIGSFWQSPSGQFYFATQGYYGTWSWNSSTNTGTWTYADPTPDQTITDTGGGIPYLATTEIDRDDADVWTSVKVTPQAGVDQVYENTSAFPRYGYSTLVKASTLHSSLNAALSTANYLGYLYHSPLPRVSSAELPCEAADGAYISDIFSINLFDVVQFQRTPPNASGAGIINLPMIVEGIAHDFRSDPGQWHVTLTLSPYEVRS
jgi:hypothetical protein